MLAQQRQAAGGYDLQKNKINNAKLDASKNHHVSFVRKCFQRQKEKMSGEQMRASREQEEERWLGERVVERGQNFCVRVRKTEVY